jgi:hypothetical protein
MLMIEEEFEDTKIRKWKKNREHNVEKKSTNNGLQNITITFNLNYCED